MQSIPLPLWLNALPIIPLPLFQVLIFRALFRNRTQVKIHFGSQCSQKKYMINAGPTIRSLIRNEAGILNFGACYPK